MSEQKYDIVDETGAVREPTEAEQQQLQQSLRVNSAYAAMINDLRQSGISKPAIIGATLGYIASIAMREPGAMGHILTGIASTQRLLIQRLLADNTKLVQMAQAERPHVPHS